MWRRQAMNSSLRTPGLFEGSEGRIRVIRLLHVCMHRFTAFLYMLSEIINSKWMIFHSYTLNHPRALVGQVFRGISMSWILSPAKMGNQFPQSTIEPIEKIFPWCQNKALIMSAVGCTVKI